MHTIIVIGFLLLGVCLAAGRWFGGARSAEVVTAARIPRLWLAAALVPMWVGVSRAACSVAAELPISLPVFAVPAAVAALDSWLS